MSSLVWYIFELNQNRKKPHFQSIFFFIDLTKLVQSICESKNVLTSITIFRVVSVLLFSLPSKMVLLDHHITYPLDVSRNSRHPRHDLILR